MKTILLAGGAGYIGSHTAVELLNAGFQVVVADNYSNSCAEAVKRVEEITGKSVKLYEVDIKDSKKLETVFQENHIDAVIHFAGLKAVGESVEKPLEYYENNVSGTLTLLRVMRKYGCRTMIFSSSATVYGSQNPVPYREEMPTSATNPYGYTKVMIEQILRDVCAADPNFTAVALRYFNPIGAHISGLLGENPNGIPNNLVPYVAQVASGKLDHVQVYGDDYDTPDGTGVRDYIHVMDLAVGHVAALAYGANHHGFEAVNLGTGHGSSVLEVIHAYEKACGRKIPVEITDRRAGDVAVSYADVSKAKELLGWEASADLQQMCSDSWRFTLQNPNGL
mgnify:CR=1 FL=1